MPQLPRFTHVLLAIGLGAVLVAICYAFVDRPVAFFVHDHGLSRFALLKDATYPPPIVQAWTPVVFALLVVRRLWGPWGRCEWGVLAACLAILVADQTRESLAYVFGRTWPQTWIDHNPSLISDGVFGFHFFHGGEGYASFPSGHMARTVSAAAVVWTLWPAGRWIAVLVSIAIAAGLIGMNYHFVGDVIGGSFVGGIVGTYFATAIADRPESV